MSFNILNTTKLPTPRIPFEKIKNAALGADYDLSLVIVNNKKSRVINRERRNKDYPTNILSFPLDETSGEIFIDIEKAREEAPAFDRTYTNFIGYLFIHGLIHLKGFDHGSTMERKEKKLRILFDI